MKTKHQGVLILFCLSLFVTCACGNAHNKSLWEFAVISDTQGNNKKEVNRSCINDEILTAIASDIAAEKPDLVLVSGDLVNGWFRNGGTDYRAQYANWKKAMEPVYTAGIMVFAVRGNHDSGPERLVLPPLPERFEPPPGSLALLEKEFRHALVRPYTPLNGPCGEEGLTYSFVHKNACFIALDQYTNGQHKINQEWLDRQLAGNRQVHIFVFGHEPAFETDHRDNLSFYHKNRDRFWDSIGRAGGRIYFCGHDHFYNRAVAKDSMGNPLRQVIAGTGGGRLREWSGSYRESERVVCEYYNNGLHGYILVTVDSAEVNVQWKTLTDVSAGAWQVYDRFSYSAAPAGH